MKNLAVNPNDGNNFFGNLSSLADITCRYIFPFLLIALAVVMKVFEPSFILSSVVILAAVAFATGMIAFWFKKATTR